MATTPTGLAADVETDGLYATMRDRYGAESARANGYRFHGYFLREQEMVFRAVGDGPGIVLDVACGSGLMVRPLARCGWRVIGVDFNEPACRAAQNNGIAVVRGDAFRLPLPAGAADRIISCQFLNQQSHDRARRFVRESSRVLRPGGRLIIVWRNGRAAVHRIAHAAYKVWDRALGRPDFPQVHHSLANIRHYAEQCGLAADLETVTFPPLRWQSERVGGPAARILGASYFVVLRKPDDAAADAPAPSET